MSFDEIVESLIKTAQARGQFDNLPGTGKKIDLTEYFNMPEDVRVAQTLLKNAGMVPMEIYLLNEIAALKEALASLDNDLELKKTQKLLREKQIEFNLLVERRKR